MRTLCKTVLIASIIVLLTAAPAAAFSDVPVSHQYAEAIEALSTLGIINGYPDGTFGPDAPVLRAQFAKMAAGMFRLEVHEGMVSSFQDLGENDGGSLYPHEFVAAAAQAGIIQGYDSQTFGTYDEVTRAQVITMGVRALDNLFPSGLEAAPAWYSGTWGNFHPIHGPNARVAQWNLLLQGIVDYDRQADAWSPMPRGEVAQFLFAMIDRDIIPEAQIEARFGEWIEIRGLRVKVEQPVADPGASYDMPGVGQKFWAVKITAENIGSVDRDVNIFNFVMHDRNGTAYEPWHWGSHIDALFDGGTLRPGDRVDGWRVFELPATAVVKAVAFDPYFIDYAFAAWK